MDAIEMGAATTTGRRAQNQDAYCVLRELGLCVVADGMGGYAGGEVASRTAVEVIKHFFEANKRDGGVTWPYGLNRELTLMENMASVAVRMADRAIGAKRRGQLAQMGTTVVLSVVAGDEIVLGHVGDSRIYRLREGELVQLTRDHSMYNELADAGCDDLPPPERFAHKNVVSRALGFSKAGAEEPDLRRESIVDGDVFLLCTDGLHDVLDGGQIADMLGALEPQQACERLLEEAYEAGSTDNITAAVLRVGARGGST
jgi:PPM family protein phosphatase